MIDSKIRFMTIIGYCVHCKITLCGYKNICGLIMNFVNAAPTNVAGPYFGPATTIYTC